MYSRKTLAKTVMAVAAIVLTTLPAVRAADASSMFIVRTTQKSPAEAVKAAESYAKMHHWVVLGANRIKRGQVTLVKVCIPEIGKRVWPQGMYLSAMLPCGNLSVYKLKGKTEVSMLSAEYMHALVPTKAMAKTSMALKPLLTGLMHAVVK